MLAMLNVNDARWQRCSTSLILDINDDQRQRGLTSTTLDITMFDVNDAPALSTGGNRRCDTTCTFLPASRAYKKLKVVTALCLLQEVAHAFHIAATRYGRSALQQSKDTSEWQSRNPPKGDNPWTPAMEGAYVVKPARRLSSRRSRLQL